MTKFTSQCHFHNNIQLSINQAKSELESIIDSCVNSTGVISYHEKIITAQKCDFHRMLLEWSRESKLDSAIRNLLLSSFYSIEEKMGGAALLAAMLLVEKLDVLAEQRHCTTKDVLDTINSWNVRGISTKIANEIFRMGACGSSVRLVEGNQSATRVRCITGQVQSGTLENLFLARVGNEFNDSRQRYVVAVDGIVETIGQLHGILQSAEKEPLLLLARGFLPDVANTLTVNFPHNLNVVPFVVTNWYEENFLNLRQRNITCVSVDTGDTIQNAKLDKKIATAISPNEIVFDAGKLEERIIEVSFGTDLGVMKGIAKDRVKLALALMRFTSRSGFMKLSYKGVDFIAPISSFRAAVACDESLSLVLRSIGAIITYKAARKKHKGWKRKNVKTKKSTKIGMQRNY